MKRTSKVVSIILAVFMLMQMMTGAVFAKIDVSGVNAPTKLNWRSKDNVMSAEFEDVGTVEVYKIELYKDNVRVDANIYEFTPDDMAEREPNATLGLVEREVIKKNGAGTYKFRVGICSDTYAEFYEHWDPDKLTVVKWSDFSPELVYNGETSNVFNVTLPDTAFDMNAENKDYEIEDIYNLFPENARESIVYASAVYTDNITKETKYTYTNLKTGEVSVVNAESSVINKILGKGDIQYDNYYNLGIKVPENLETGAYKLEIDLPVADGKECATVKPLHVTINRFAYYDKPEFDFVGITKYCLTGVDEKVPMTKDQKVTIKFNQNAMDCFDKFYLLVYGKGDERRYEEYKLDKDVVEIPITDLEYGYQDLLVIFGSDDYEKGCDFFKSIILYNTVTFMADGKVVGTYDLRVGNALFENDIEELINAGIINPPAKEGYVITGWEGLPDKMPAAPVTATAIYEVEPPLAKGVIDNGKFNWSYYKDGTLYINGEGAMQVPDDMNQDDYYTYLSARLADGESIRAAAKKIVVGEGITEIGDEALYEFYDAEKVTLPSTLEKIGYGFMKGSSVKEVIIPANVKTINMNGSFIKCPSELAVTFLNKDVKLTTDGTDYGIGAADGITLCGYTGSEVEAFANSDEHKCNFVSIDPDFVINGGAESTKDKNIKIVLNKYALENFKQYKIDGEFKDVTENIDYVLDNKDGEKTISITFKNDNFEIVKEHKISLDNKHKITYVADGKTVGEETVGCGAKIDTKIENPSKEGYTFVKWDIPAEMPDNDITANAIFVKNADDETLKSLLTEEEIAEGVTVKTDVKAADENENIALAIANKYSTYTASIILDINIIKEKAGSEVGKITDASELIAFTVDIPSNVQGKSEYIVLREHNGVVDALTTRANADGEYIKVDGNTLTIFANKFSAYALIAADKKKDNPPRKGSSSGSSTSGFTVKFETNGGSTVKAITTTKNTKITEPEAPVKDGFVFDGWYTDSAFKTKFDFASPVTGAMTLYAKWTEKAKTSIILTIGSKEALLDVKTVTNDVEPKIVNDRTMLPIRFIAEALGAKVEWIEDTETVKITADGIDITIKVGEEKATVNGKEIALDSPSFIENDRTYLPLRFVSENLGATVDWNEAEQKVTVTK